TFFIHKKLRAITFAGDCNNKKNKNKNNANKENQSLNLPFSSSNILFKSEIGQYQPDILSSIRDC
ncbi:8634_t:CDS:2, partial [Entrophospora sp. SA101]